MARINLRPWRDELRAKKQRQFLVSIAGFMVVGIIYIMAANWIKSTELERQNVRNDYMVKQIATMDSKIREIDKLNEKLDQLIERMRVIQELQGNRPVIVHVFDELVRNLPDGVYYKKLALTQNKISMGGTADSNNRISSLMRKLDESEWFSSPNLTSVSANVETAGKASDFNLSVQRGANKEEARL